jgi:MFS family permease
MRNDLDPDQPGVRASAAAASKTEPLAARPDVRFASNIPRFFLYTAIKGFGFGLFAALWVIYLQRERGLSLSQAALIDVTFFVAATLGEVPTGIVADRLGRKRSLAIGAALVGASTLAWALAPTMALIVVAYTCLGVGYTFLSGADDALFYESARRAGRSHDYTRLAGRAGATMTVAFAAGGVASGLLASVSLTLPFLAAAASYVGLFAVVLTFHELAPDRNASADRPQRSVSTLRAAITLLRTRPPLRYPAIYLAVVPVAALILETLLVQPQAVAFGIPVAGIGALAMGLQITGAAGAMLSDRLARRSGETAIVWAAPVLIVAGLVLLARLQAPPALAFIGVVGLVTAIQRPILYNRIQTEVPDDVRATVLSILSLASTAIAGITQTLLGAVADRSGLPATYAALAVIVGLPSLVVLVAGRRYLRSAPSLGSLAQRRVDGAVSLHEAAA